MGIRFNNTQTNYDETKTVNTIIITKTANSEEQENFEFIATEKTGEEQIELARINLSRNGALTSNNITFDMNINFGIDMSLFDPTAEMPSVKIRMKNLTNFSGVPKEGKFEQGNHLVINELAPEQITNLFTNLGTLLGEKLKDEMFVTLITNITTVNDGLFDAAQQAMQETQNALEHEQQLLNEYTPEDFNANINSTGIQDAIENESNLSQLRGMDGELISIDQYL